MTDQLATARTWTIELPAGLTLLNANERMHWAPKSAITREIRRTAWALAKQAGVPALKRAHVDVEYRPPDRRRRDVHNLYPSAKACVDGLVDAGVLPDDNDEHLTGPDMRIGPRVTGGQLVLHIRDAAQMKENT